VVLRMQLYNWQHEKTLNASEFCMAALHSIMLDAVVCRRMLQVHKHIGYAYAGRLRCLQQKSV